MREYTIKRLALFVPTIILATMLVFALFWIVPGDAAFMILTGGDQDSGAVTLEQLDKLREELGLNKPIYSQYGHWIWNIMRGDLGTSIWYNIPVWDELEDRFYVTIELAVMAILMAFVVAVPLGVISAVKQDSWGDYSSRIFVLIGIALPTFWLGILMVYGLAYLFNWLPPLGYANVWEDPLTNLQQLVFPALCLAFHDLAFTARVTRSSMLEVMREDYMRTARAKGLKEFCCRGASRPQKRLIACGYHFRLPVRPLTGRGNHRRVHLRGAGHGQSVDRQHLPPGLCSPPSDRPVDRRGGIGDQPGGRSALRSPGPPDPLQLNRRCKEKTMVDRTGEAVFAKESAGWLSYSGATIRALMTFGRRKPLGAVGGLVVLFLVFIALTSPVLAPYGNREIIRVDGKVPVYHAPSLDYPLGTDRAGRDTMSRVMWGARISMYVAGMSVAIGITFFFLVGVFSAYVGGKVDLVIQRIVDAQMALPGLVIALAIMAALGSSLNNVVLAIVIGLAPPVVRTVRSQVLSLKEMDYVLAARAVGASPARIMLRHIVPNCFATYLILATYYLGFAIILEATLSFLGVGSPVDMPSWGGMLTAASQVHIKAGPWTAIFPGLAIFIVVIGFNLLGDALRDVLDPRLRGSGKR